MLFQVTPEAVAVRVMDKFNPAFADVIYVRRNISQVIGKKGDLVAEITQESEDVKHSDRTRIPISHREVMIDHEDSLLPRMRCLQSGHVAIGRLLGQDGIPSRR